MSVIVGSAYSTKGSNNRKIVRLNNDHLVAIAYRPSSPYYTYLYRSTDNGATWSQLCYISGLYEGAGICSVGNIVYVIGYVATTKIYCIPIDETTVTNSDQNSAKVTVDTITGTVDYSPYRYTNVAITADSSGNLHAAWSAKVAAYPDCGNIRYSKSTDGGATWATPTQLTNLSSSNECYFVNIATNSSDHPLIVWKELNKSNGAEVKTYSRAYTGSSWGITYDLNLKAYNKPSLSVDSAGNFHIVSVASSLGGGIYYTTSSDSGANWSANANIVSSAGGANDNPVCAYDTLNSKLYVLFERSSQIYMKAGSAAIAAISALTASSATYPNMMMMPLDNMLGCLYVDGQATDIIYYAINTNKAPTAPTGLTRANYDVTANGIFTWTFNDDTGDTQSAYQLQIREVGAGADIVDTGKVTSATSSYTCPGGTLTNGKQYQWRVKTWDAGDLEGAWSAYATFYAVAAPVTAISAPAADGATVVTNHLTVTWTYTDDGGLAQSAYRVKIYTAADALLWDSGKLFGDDVSLVTPYTLLNATNYRVKVTTWNSYDIPSAEVTRTFKTSFTAPATPALTLTTPGAYINIAINNPTPQGTQPAVYNNDLYRRVKGIAAWKRIAAAIAVNGSYADYTAASGVTYEYKVTANGASGITADSATAEKSLILSGVWLHDVSDAAGTSHQFRLDGGGRSTSWNLDAQLMQFDGRTYPVAEFGGSQTGGVSFNLGLTQASGDLAALEALVARKATLCYRDGRGRKAFGVITSLSVSDGILGVYSANMQLYRIDYDEEVQA